VMMMESVVANNNEPQCGAGRDAIGRDDRVRWNGGAGVPTT
jgi:hypothetical protein